MEESTNVDLGYVEECESWLLTNTYFPSKVGGKPAWLELDALPDLTLLKCKRCEEILVFLCQIYASEEKIANAFHRTIFVFVCKTSSCWQPNCSKNIVAFRSQLPRANNFYNYEPPNEQIQLPPIIPFLRLCEICGIRGPYNCSNCKEVSYCSRAHQKIDWLNSHRAKCRNSPTPKQVSSKKYQFLLPEFELVIEPEQLSTTTKSKANDNGVHNDKNDDDDEDEDEEENDNDDDAANTDPVNDNKKKCVKETDEESELRRQKLAKELNEKNTDNDNLGNLNEAEFLPYAHQDQDEIFTKFKKRIDQNKEQVIRYDRNGEPLWITKTKILPMEKVPNCELCGSRRVFEFQIMPQLLNNLKDDNLDWGIINVYTCEQNCDINSYVKEFVYKQDIS